MRESNYTNSVQGLIDYLELKGKNHKKYFHYTTWDSLKKIYENNSFLLTRGNSLKINDQHEAIMKGSYQEWNKTYIASFSFGSSENMAMWGLYGLPWEDAVRIAIPQKEMLSWLDSIKDVEVWDPQKKNNPLNNIRVCLNDIVYVNGKKNDDYYQLTHASRNWIVRNEAAFYRFDESSLMTGYIKNYAWHYENEVRLKITTPFDVHSEKIKIDIPFETITSFEITTGPCFEYKNDKLYSDLMSNGKLNPSGFEHLVKYRPLCSLCQHKKFEKKLF